MNKNDEKILQLKENIKIKKSEANKIKQFIPITNCLIELDGIRLNIHTLSLEHIISLRIKIHSYYKSACELNLKYTINGFDAQDWLSDLKQKGDILITKQKQKELKDLEKTLDKLLSEDKQKELEIDEVENILNSL